MIKDTMKGIVIGTSEYSKDFLRPLLDSIKEIKYNVLIVSNGSYNPVEVIDSFLKENSIPKSRYSLVINSFNGWEVACIQRGKETFNEFIFIHDTTLIKDISFFDKVFAIEGNVVFTKGNFHYMGKFVTRELPNLPRVHDKVTAIMMETTWLNGFKFTEFNPDLPVHSLNYEEMHGMKRMRIENEYMVKWKGTVWISKEQLDELTEQERAKLNKETSSK